MTDAIHDGFYKPKNGFVVPADYGMYSEQANFLIRDALAKCLRDAASIAGARGLDFKERLAAFQDLEVTRGPTEMNYNDFFRYTPPDAYDREGNPVHKKPR